MFVPGLFEPALVQSGVMVDESAFTLTWKLLSVRRVRRVGWGWGRVKGGGAEGEGVEAPSIKRQNRRFHVFIHLTGVSYKRRNGASLSESRRAGQGSFAGPLPGARGTLLGEGSGFILTTKDLIFYRGSRLVGGQRGALIYTG